MKVNSRRLGGPRLVTIALALTLLHGTLAEAQFGRGRGRATSDFDAQAIGAGVEGVSPAELIRKAQEQMKKGAYAEAEPYARQALAMAEQRGGQRATGVAASILGTALFHMGHAPESEAMLRRALPLREAEVGPNHRSVLMLMGLLGIGLGQQGKFSEAVQVLQGLVQREQSITTPGDPALTRAHMHYATVLTLTGNFASAEEYFRKAIDNAALADNEANSKIVERTYHQYAKLLMQRKRVGDAAQAARRSVELAEKLYGQESTSYARNMVVLGQALMMQGDSTQADAILTRAAPLCEKLLGRNHPETASANLMLGLLAERSGRTADTENALKRAIEALRQNGSPTQLVRALTHYARFLSRYDRDAEALVQYKLVLDTVDRMYAGTKGLDEETRLAFANRYAPLYYETVRLLVKMHRANPRGGYDRETLSVVSRTQSRLFAEMLRQADVKRFSSDAAFQQLQQSRDTVLEKLAKARGTRAARVRLDDPDATVDARGFFARSRAESIAADSARQISELESNLKTVEDRLSREFPRYMELIQPRPLGVAELQGLLRPGEALLSYFILGQETIVFALTPRAFAMRPAGVTRRDLAELVWQARRTSVSSGGSLADLSALDPAILHRLYSALVQPVEGFLRPGQKIMVVADGPLYTLPLEMLVTAYGPQERARFEAARAAHRQPLEEFATLPYLGDRYRFSYLPNLAALTSQRLYARPPVAFDRELVSFADPVFSRANGEAGLSEATRSLLKIVNTRTGSALLPRLPETADEAQGIAKALGGKSSIFLRENAQERTAKTTDLHATRFVHFATHGLLGGEFLQVKQSLDEGDNGKAASTGTQRNLVVEAADLSQEDEAPGSGAGRKPAGGQPALALTLVDTQGEDGLLTMSEVIENLDLNADVVVLSACNTAGESAEASNGEGFAGLTRAFMYAGARSLIVSHWSVDSISTTMLVTTAFSQMKTGMPLDQALRDARAKVRASSGDGYSRAHPFFWAPFVEIGD